MTKFGTTQELVKADLMRGSTYVNATLQPRRIPSPVRWLFLLFVFMLPFDAVKTDFIIGSLPRLAGVLFFAVYVLYYGPFLGKRPFPPVTGAMCCFLAYIAVVGLNGIFIDEKFVDEFVTRCFTLAQLVVLFWIASDLLKDEKTVRSVLFTLSIATSSIAIGNLVRLPGFYEPDVGAPGRVSAIGDNPNALAATMAMALVAIVGLFITGSSRRSLRRVCLLLLTVPLLMVLVTTGSRGGVLGFAVGGLVYVVPLRASKRLLISVGLGTLLIGGVVYKVATTPEFLERWRQTYYEGDLSRREDIFATSYQMILERPFLGWHPVECFYELGRRGEGISTPRDAHNLYLALLLEVGIIGTIPYLAGLCICARAAWKARLGNLGLLPMALLSVLFAGSLAGNATVWKQQWLLLALAFGASVSTRVNERVPVLVRHHAGQKHAKVWTRA